MNLLSIIRTIAGYKYVTRKKARSFNEVHTTKCSYGRQIKVKRYLTHKQAMRIIIADEGKKHFDGCRFCMPVMNTEEVGQSRS